MKRILVPTAGSASAFECADYVMTIAKSLQAEVHVLHVIANGDDDDLESADAAIRVFELASEEYDVGVKGFVRSGRVVEEIIKYSEGNEICLVLMGASRGEVVEQWTSCDVLGHSGVPVLVIPAQVLEFSPV